MLINTGLDLKTRFTQVLMKELEHMIHVRKIFNWRVYFKILLSLYLVIVEKELWIKFKNGTFEKITITSRFHPSFLTLFLNKKYKYTHGIPWHHLPFKSQVYAKHSSTTALVLYPHVLLKAKNFLITLTWQT